MTHPLVRLGRRFTVDWLNRADQSVPPQIMTPDYRVHIGPISIDGLAAYTAATAGQLRQFPGLALTIHQLLTDGDRLALVFTEHGASTRHDGRAAGWRGVALFDWDGERLTENWTQEDYQARRRQLADGTPDVIAAPAVSPWTTAPESPSPAAESAVRDWLAAPTTAGITLDDGRCSELALRVTAVTEQALFSAGAQVAFAVTWTGTCDERSFELGAAGVLTVSEGGVTGGTVVTDRAGLARSARDNR